MIRLSAEAEPEIYRTTRTFGTILENVVVDERGVLDLDDDSKTENTRAAYKLEQIANALPTKRAGHPSAVVMLTADAFGILPPIARLTRDQAMFYFLSGFTAKLAGTEIGVTEPQPTFSTCFGAPFLPQPPAVYARMLGEKLDAHGADGLARQHGWTGGPFGEGHRMPIEATRALLRAALVGRAATASSTAPTRSSASRCPVARAGRRRDAARPALDLARPRGVRRARPRELARDVPRRTSRSSPSDAGEAIAAAGPLRSSGLSAEPGSPQEHGAAVRPTPRSRRTSGGPLVRVAPRQRPPRWTTAPPSVAVGSAAMETHDVLVVGAGCAGMRAAIEAHDAGADVAVVSKLHPTRSHSGAAEGGINAALGNAAEDSPEIHAFDTVKGSDYLGDQDAIEIFTREAPGDIYQLEHWGCVFSRNDEGKLAQRPFGAAGSPRTVYAADITGHVLIQVLYEQLLKRMRGINVYEEYFAWQLVDDDGRCQGVICWDLLNGGLKAIGGKTIVLATGGVGRLFRATTNAYACTGDGMAMALRAGAAAEGHGVHAVPPDDDVPDRDPDHRGLPRRGRVPAQQGRRALHEALRAERDGARLARRRLALRADRDRRRARRQRLRPPRPAPPRRREDPHAPARLARARDDLRRRRPDLRADPGPAGRPLPHGRRRDATSGA